ncbi:ABC transporter ATP-binding protein [Dermabacter hominis]|uniref:ABC transporter ATP-binding protein n=1 Tax=Dermabacter hominis TaxID=36740 RepID=UPI0021A47E5F|nr:ABC transporter ATP-binding protein [Dermabacter hominis]MCT1807245.1 ABC transporter ATP-binding protein [Dermabacter hominis]MDU5963155.1 ABC transporter ATP-binding protein [Dermabacter sp.]
MVNLVDVKDVSIAFGSTPVLSHASLAIDEHDFMGVQGPNGSGKSVLFKLIVGFLKPDSGRVVVSPKLKSAGEDFPSKIGIIIDRPGFIGGLTGFDNLRRLASIRGLIGDQQIEEALHRVGLAPNLRQSVRHYSLGMKQKLALAQEFMEGQPLLLLDEPFNGLDKTSVRDIRALLLELHEEGRTIVMTSHNQEDIDELCTSVYELDRMQFDRVRPPVSAS